jgi:hypothetical protein
MSRTGSGDHVAKATPWRTPGVRGIGLVGMGGSDRTSDKRSLEAGHLDRRPRQNHGHGQKIRPLDPPQIRFVHERSSRYLSPILGLN